MATTRARCGECRKTFTPSPTAAERQRVCGESCRLARRRKLARDRRAADLAGYREDERARQRVHRAKARDAPAGAVRHAPGKPPKGWKAPVKMVQFVDRALALSRASLLRDLRQIVGDLRNSLADTG